GEGTRLARLERIAKSAPDGGERTYLLLDRDREPTDWFGPGLLHDLDAGALPERGLALRQSATSATLLAVAPIDGPGQELVVVGESLPRDGRAPVERALAESWTGGRWAVAGGARPALWELAWQEPPERRRGRAGRAARQLAGLIVALGLLTLGALRAAGRVLLAGTVVPRRDPTPAVLLLCGVAPWLAAASLGAGPVALVSLAAGLAVALLGWARGRSEGRGSHAGLLVGAAAGPALMIAARGLAPRFPELSGALVGSVSDVAMRLAAAGTMFGCVALGAGLRAPGWKERWPWIAAATAVAAGALADHAAVAIVLLALAGAAAVAATRPAELGSARGLAATALLAALVAGAAWAVGERAARADQLDAAASALAPPGTAERTELVAVVASALARSDAAALEPPTSWLSERGDLAFAVWRGSPLARSDALTALVVESADGSISSFSSGLPLDRAGRLDPAPSRWVDILPTSWLTSRLEGETVAASGRWTVRWWLVPRLGFGAGAPAGDPIAGLLRGGSELRRPFGLGPELRWAAWDPEGELRSSSWEEGTPELAAVEMAATSGRPVATAEGRSAVATWSGPEDGTVAVFLPPLGPAAALERAGAVALGALLALVALCAVALLGSMPRSAVRDLVRRALRSYSRRLLIVFAVLLLVPVTLLYVLLSRTLERRLEREQEQAARTALSSVQRVLGEYVLTLEPGFGIGTAIDDPLLELLARVAHREVNLYWGGEIYASSKRDLFAAGLLPRRLPGEIRGRLSPGGEALARRTSRAGETEYLELYAPLEIPGEPRRETRLILSMPLLAQQEEALAEIAALRRRALLVTAGLFLLLAATGSRLARRFTRPIEEIVAGTRRIAAGEDRLGVRPEEAELEAIAEAIDRMAASVAQGRTRLLAEKRLVDRIVESVTAGVVALDAAGRVLILNRVARDLLGVEPGDDLAATLAQSSQLAPVAGLVSSAAEGASRTVVRLGAEGEEREWTAVRVPLPGAGEADALLVVEDVTDVVRAQRLAAWAEMARIIAHEIKNPLTPIRLSAEHLREAWSRDREHFEQVFERAIANILRQVEELREIASEFSIFSRIPQLERQDGDLVELVAELVESYRGAPGAGPEWSLESRPEKVLARFDPRLMRRAVRNLLENAVRASGEAGSVEVRVEAEAGAARVAVADRGPGVPPELLGRILEPYFSTHANGTGLGLPI
ncbi:MAG TPA: ATP-binding protein, partial [Thermoanaerobaculia bacterium]|nr:ATP-binding protein [Thermoanaerobaculia bacterium]